MKKKYISIVLLVIMSMWLVACRGNMPADEKDDLDIGIGESQVDTEIESVTIRDVVFLNNFREGQHGPDIDLREIILCQYDLLEGEETLYGFHILAAEIPDEIKSAIQKQEENGKEELEIQNWLDAQLRDVMLQEEFAIISHPQQAIVCAGTMAQWEELFEERGGRIGEWGIFARSVGRPDAPEIFDETGWTEGEDIEEWFNDHYEEISQLVGPDKQVTLSVPVILSEDAEKATK